MTKRESRKQRSNWPAMQRSLKRESCIFIILIQQRLKDKGNSLRENCPYKYYKIY
ncbi:hypothetical protein [Porphyromonas pogonae]|uniref:hypothetical protein n=1 Tax=Porphyromonas pogonae TaxID=867595 RepID=UPI002E784233|nr:hypothetical protein [Porphyromonas pogonae]